MEEVADIEYLQLELNDDFLFAGEPLIITSDKITINQNGDILIFSRDGKPFLKFNHKGTGPGEYPYIEQLFFDELSDEIFIKYADKIITYSSKGEYKRTIPLLGITYNLYSQIENFDSETFLIYDSNNLYPSTFSFISKKDGAVTDSIITPKGNPVKDPLVFLFLFTGFEVINVGVFKSCQ